MRPVASPLTESVHCHTVLRQLEGARHNLALSPPFVTLQASLEEVQRALSDTLASNGVDAESLASTANQAAGLAQQVGKGDGGIHYQARRALPLRRLGLDNQQRGAWQNTHLACERALRVVPAAKRACGLRLWRALPVTS